MVRCAAVITTLCLLMPAPFAAPPAAQSLPTGINTGAMSQGTQLLNSFASGQINTQQFTSAITATGNISLPDANQLTSNIVKNLSADLGSLGSVVDGVMSGNLNPQTAMAMAGIPDLGKINSIGDLAKLASNPAVQSAVQNVMKAAGAEAAAGELAKVMSGAATQQLAANLMQQAGLPQQLAQQVAAALGPALTAALGGLQKILDELLKNLGIKINITPGGGGGGSEEGPPKQNNNNNVACERSCPGCCNCHKPIVENHKNIRALMTNEFEAYRTWLVSKWWLENMAPALMIMTSQMTAAAINQVEIFGMMLDAKHQLETQRLFQEMTARAHKDYQPSEGLCEFGTNTRSLAASERRAELSRVAFAQRMLKRSLKSGDTTGVTGQDSDKASRLQQFINDYCDKNDNGEGADGKGGLEILCKKAVKPERQNKDIDYTRTIDTPLTLDVDFLKAENTDDEKDIFSLTANLFAHDIPQKMPRELLANEDGEVRPDAYPLYMDLRSVTAKRSVAQNSMAAVTAMKSRGAKDVAPFLKAFVRDLGLAPEEIDKLIGEEPSYFAQMEVLTKKIYENPVFYVNLYDKPVNVERKIAVMEALEIMQDRDIYDSLLRSEAVLAVYLETLLGTEQERVSNEINGIMNSGTSIEARGQGTTTPTNDNPVGFENEDDIAAQSTPQQNQNNQNNTNNTGNNNNTGGNSGGGNTASGGGAAMAQGLNNGSMSPQQVASNLTQSGNVTPAQAAAVVQGLQSSPNIDPDLSAHIFDSIMDGSMHPQVAIGLAATANAGNINSTSELAQTLNNSSLRSGLNDVYSQLGAQGLAQHIGHIMNSVADYPLAGRLGNDTATLNALMDGLESVAPDLVNNAGGRAALSAAIRLAASGGNVNLPSPSGGWNNTGGGANP